MDSDKEKRIKESFKKVREDINSLYSETDFLREQLKTIQTEMSNIVGILEKMGKNIQKTKVNTLNGPSTHSTQNTQKQTFSTNTSTDKSLLNPLKPQNLGISTRNRGASTDRQTDRQTDIRHIKQPLNSETPKDQDSIDSAAHILDSLDGMKKEIRRKFKRLTDQEFLVFSTLYQLDEEEGYVDYKTLAQKLGLSESSIRDYIGRLIKKGVPVGKKRVNNKMIHLSISDNLKKIASLPTILQLRDL